MGSPDAPLVAAGKQFADGRRIGVLLCHGFTGTPASMRPWAQFLNAHGYDVSVPLLPGHATTWEDLNVRRWTEWYSELTSAYLRLAATVDDVIVGGLSMGGGLALKLAADHPEIRALILVNPAVKLSRWDLKALPLAKYVIDSLDGIGSDLKKQGVEERGYSRTPLRALHEMVRGTKQIRAALPAVTQPVLLVTSVTDHVVDPASRDYILRHLGSNDLSEIRLLDSYHVATLDNDQQLIFDRSLEFIREVTMRPADELTVT